jgi:hypothetical protein
VNAYVCLMFWSRHGLMIELGRKVVGMKMELDRGTGALRFLLIKWGVLCWFEIAYL